ncbi:MAG: L-serine ammonia-lyase, iron-sulfur-dependent, subunit alpha [Synergistales bacterium]|nr:L-serine ammonia-lyase, iron-sulfur-dependent, subunit alpha [Synergistales bacterium]
MDIHSELMSIFDVLGPVMTGPSSSHTAGAVRIGLMARWIFGGQPEGVDVTMYGSLAETYQGHMTDAGVIAGLLGMPIDDPAIAVARKRAEQQGIEVAIHPEKTAGKNPNTIELSLAGGGVSLEIESVTVGGGEIMIASVDGVSVDLHGKEPLLLLFCEAGKGGSAAESLKEKLHKSCTLHEGARWDLVTCQVKEPPGEKLLQFLGAIAGVVRVRSLPSLYEYYAAAPYEPPFTTIERMIEHAHQQNVSLVSVLEEFEKSRSGLAPQGVHDRLQMVWKVMQEAADRGLCGDNPMVGGIMPGDDAHRLFERYKRADTLSGPVVSLAIAKAIASMEVNASMGKVCAAPTAGSCGVLPGALASVAELMDVEEGKIVEGLLVAGIFGVLVAAKAPVSGAMGGCQSEIGVASAMAAAALAHIGGGAAEQTAEAFALALKSMLGLACDPVAGPVEVPCIKRNAVGVANAFSAADMACAGIKSVIPPDEVIDALLNVQTLLPEELRDTTIGGLGSTKTAHRLKEEWLARLAGGAAGEAKSGS